MALYNDGTRCKTFFSTYNLQRASTTSKRRNASGHEKGGAAPHNASSSCSKQTLNVVVDYLFLFLFHVAVYGRSV